MILIATPIHGQSVHEFNISLDRALNTIPGMDVLIIYGDSCIERARNNAVCSFLESDFRRLLFIDSDIEFTPEDIQKLIDLDEDICCGSYPFKKFPIQYTTWKDGKKVNLDGLEGPTEVDFAATGFMMVKRDVFMEMRTQHPEKSHMEGDEKRLSYAWFAPRVSEGDFPDERIYLSEDYAFSEDVRKLGKKIILEPSIRLKHYGMYGFGE